MTTTNTRALAIQGHADRREQQSLSTQRLRSHPLAMDPTLVRQLCAASLERRGAFQQHSAVVVPFERVDRDALLAAAVADYFREARPPAGHARALADKHGVDYGQLLHAIGQRYRQA